MQSRSTLLLLSLMLAIQMAAAIPARAQQPAAPAADDGQIDQIITYIHALKPHEAEQAK